MFISCNWIITLYQRAHSYFSTVSDSKNDNNNNMCIDITSLNSNKHHLSYATENIIEDNFVCTSELPSYLLGVTVYEHGIPSTEL